jgi:hypothetical protein
VASRTTALDRLVSQALVIEDEDAKDGGHLRFTARALAMATMPHKKVEGSEFSRRNGHFSMTMLAPSRIGLPYGSLPRLLMAWVTTEAVKTRSAELDLGHSMSGFMKEIGVPHTTGKRGHVHSLKEQSRRLFNSTVSCSYEKEGATADIGYRIASHSILWWDTDRGTDPAQDTLFASKVTLSPDFYKELIEAPIPVDMRALAALRRSPLALDLYTWASWRVSYLEAPVEIPWAGLAAQFGSEYSRLRDFKAAFLSELRKVQLVFPVKIAESEFGLRLSPGPTSIRKLSKPVDK